LEFRESPLESLDMNKDFWKGKKVLITGHTGFKGSWLSLWLQYMGAKVIGYALPPPTEPNLFSIADVDRGMISVVGDIRDLKSLDVTIFEHRPEIVIHLAAQALVRASYADPIGTFSTNVMGTANVLEAVRNSETIKVAIIITSDKCYENNEWVWGYRESDPMGGHDPYSSSKGCAELVAAAYMKSFFSGSHNSEGNIAIATARAGNVIGGGDWSKDRLIPDIMSSMMNGQAIMIRSPQSIRPWQHVLESLRGYLMLAESLWCHGSKFSGSWNFGPDDKDNKTVSWIADFITKQWGYGARWITDSNQHLHEAAYLKLDCSKSKQFLGWWPALDLPTTIQWIIEWYQALKRDQNMKKQTLEDIHRYEEIVQLNYNGIR
jgi:CDP-glucose 4,6-dehydratase